MNDVPVLLTVDDVARYRGTTKTAASTLCRQLEIAGWYCPPIGSPIALYAATDANVTCENGHLKPKRSRGTCRTMQVRSEIRSSSMIHELNPHTLHVFGVPGAPIYDLVLDCGPDIYDIRLTADLVRILSKQLRDKLR